MALGSRPPSTETGAWLRRETRGPRDHAEAAFEVYVRPEALEDEGCCTGLELNATC
jgi:hypothetical protein